MRSIVAKLVVALVAIVGIVSVQRQGNEVRARPRVIRYRRILTHASLDRSDASEP